MVLWDCVLGERGIFEGFLGYCGGVGVGVVGVIWDFGEVLEGVILRY